MKFFFIIPVFNDEKSLVKLIQEIKNILNKDSNELNFIIVNDASNEKLNNLSNILNAHLINLKSNPKFYLLYIVYFHIITLKILMKIFID